MSKSKWPPGGISAGQSGQSAKVPRVGSASMAQPVVGCGGTPEPTSKQATECAQEVVEDSYWHTCWLCVGNSARSAGSQAAHSALRCARGRLRDCIMVHLEMGCGGSAAKQQVAPDKNPVGQWHCTAGGRQASQVWVGPGKSLPVQCTILASTVGSTVRSEKTTAMLLMTARLECLCGLHILLPVQLASSHASTAELGAATAVACAAAGTRDCQRCLRHIPCVRSAAVLRQCHT